MAGIVARLRARRPKNLCSIPGRYRSFFQLQIARTGFAAHPTSYSIYTGNSCPGLKRLIPVTDNPPPSSAEVRN